MSSQNTDDTSCYTDTTTTVPHKSMATDCLPTATIQCDTPTDKHTNSTMSSPADFSSVQEVSDSEVWCCGIRKRRRPKGYRSLGKPSKSNSRSPFNRLTCEERKTFIDLIKEPVARSFGVGYDQLPNTGSCQSESDSETDTHDEISENTASLTESKCECNHSVSRPENYCIPQVVTNQFTTSCYAAQHNTSNESCISALKTSSKIQDNKKDVNFQSNSTSLCNQIYNDTNSYLLNHARYSYESSGLAFVAKASIQPMEFAARDDYKQQYQCPPAPHLNLNYKEGTPATMQIQSLSNHLDFETSQISPSHEFCPVNKTAAPSLTEPETNHPDSRHSCTPDISEIIQVSDRDSAAILPNRSAVYPWIVQGCGGPFEGGLVASSRISGSRGKVRTQIKVGQRLRIVPKRS